MSAATDTGLSRLSSGPFVAVGGAMVITGGIVAAVNSAAPFDRGSWLAAYLVLVAGVAQIALGEGGRALDPGIRPAWLTSAETMLWNAGGLAVPAGVLSGQAVLVALGSVALLTALTAFAVAVRGAPRSRGRTAYHVMIAGLGVSVLVGCTLGDAAPAAWVF